MSAWIQHVKQFASENGMKYGEALSHPECKSSYHASKGNRAVSSEGAGIGKAFKKLGNTKKMHYGKKIMNVMDKANDATHILAKVTKPIPLVSDATEMLAYGNDKLTKFSKDVHQSRKEGGSDGKIFKRALGRTATREGKQMLEDEIDDLLNNTQEGSGLHKALSHVKHAFKNSFDKTKHKAKDFAMHQGERAKDYAMHEGRKLADRAIDEGEKYGRIALKKGSDFAREEGSKALKGIKNEARDIYNNEGKQLKSFAKEKAKATYKQLQDTAVGEFRNKSGDARELMARAKAKAKTTLEDDQYGSGMMQYMNYDDDDDEIFGRGVQSLDQTQNAMSRYPAYMVSRGAGLQGGSFRVNGGSFRVN